MQIEVYSDDQNPRWDEFVGKSKNATFLFLREYMDYHRARFEDHSLLVSDDKNRLRALLPMSKEGSTGVSHAGLTYGGFITDAEMTTPFMMDLVDYTLEYLAQQRFAKLVYKTIPHIYHRLPAEEDHYALFRHNARLSRRDITTVVRPGLQPKLQKRRQRSMKRAQEYGVTWGFSEDYAQFWTVLEDNLQSVHGISPVHMLDEICCLQSSFPDNIKLFCAFLDGKVVAGTVIYETHTVAHAQYIASSRRGKDCGALDLLFFCLIKEQYADKEYFDFGISTEEAGRFLNSGLIEFKEGFGGGSVTHDVYEIDLAPQKHEI